MSASLPAATGPVETAPRFVPAALPDRLAGDDELVDLAGAVVDAEHADVTVEALDAGNRDMAGAAEYLDGAVGDSAERLAGEIFGRGRLEGDRVALVLQPGRLHDERPRRHRLGL